MSQVNFTGYKLYTWVDLPEIPEINAIQPEKAEKNITNVESILSIPILNKTIDFQPRLGSILWFYLVYVLVDVDKLI